MKIAIFTHYFHPHVGGIEVVAETHAKQLAERGHDVRVVTTAVDADQRVERRDGYRIHRYSAANPLESLGMPYPVPNPADCVSVARSVLDDSFDIVHVHGLNYLTSLLPLLSGVTRDTSVILHQHTPFVDYSPLLNLAERLNDNVVGRLVLSRADHCVAVSENIAEYTSRLGAESVTTMYNGVDTERFTPDVAATRNEFLYLGRLTQKKGVARLLRAVERLDDRETNAVVRIAGSGELSDTIERKADSLSNLEYDGFVSSDDLPEIYSRARALLVPKQAGDAFPTLTILEALASGTAPVLVKDTVSAPGFTAGETYVRARPTAASLADAIAKLAADRRLVDRLGARSRQCALDHYEWESRIDDLEALYRTVGSGTVS